MKGAVLSIVSPFFLQSSTIVSNQTGHRPGFQGEDFVLGWCTQQRQRK